MKCRPFLGIFFYKKWGHQWKSTGLFPDGLSKDAEQQCLKCGEYRHSFSANAYDIGVARPGRHPASKPKPPARPKKPVSDATLSIFDELKKEGERLRPSQDSVDRLIQHSAVGKQVVGL